VNRLTKPDHATSHQLELKARHRLSDREFAEMLEMLGALTPEEKRGLEAPDFITEDEADMIVVNRRRGGRGIPAEEVIAEFRPPKQRV
jgi:hypothetical protein